MSNMFSGFFGLLFTFNETIKDSTNDINNDFESIFDSLDIKIIKSKLNSEILEFSSNDFFQNLINEINTSEMDNQEDFNNFINLINEIENNQIISCLQFDKVIEFIQLIKKSIINLELISSELNNCIDKINETTISSDDLYIYINTYITELYNNRILLINKLNSGKFLSEYRQNKVNTFFKLLYNLHEIILDKYIIMYNEDNNVIIQKCYESVFSLYDFIKRNIYIYHEQPNELIKLNEVIEDELLDEYQLPSNLNIMKTDGNGMCFLNAILDYIYVNKIESINPLFSGKLFYQYIIEYLANQKLGQNEYMSSDLGCHVISYLKMNFSQLKEPTIIIIQNNNSYNKPSYSVEIFEDKEDQRHTSKKSYILLYCNGNHYSLVKSTNNQIKDFYDSLKMILYNDNMSIDTDKYNIIFNRLINY